MTSEMDMKWLAGIVTHSTHICPDTSSWSGRVSNTWTLFSPPHTGSTLTDHLAQVTASNARFGKNIYSDYKFLGAKQIIGFQLMVCSGPG